MKHEGIGFQAAHVSMADLSRAATGQSVHEARSSSSSIARARRRWTRSVGWMVSVGGWFGALRQDDLNDNRLGWDGRRTEPEIIRVLALTETGGVLEAVRGGVVEDLAEPGVRVEREHVHVVVVLGEGCGVGGERGVVLGDVLLVEGRAGLPEPGWGTVDGRDVDEEVRAAEVVVVGALLWVVE